MVQLFLRAFVAVAGAFVLGLAVGWLIWRLHRRSVPGEEWSASQQALEDLRRTLAELEGQRDQLVRQVASWQAEASGLQSRVSSAWHEREAARAHADQLETQLGALRQHFDQAVAHNHHLQRRVTELSLMVSRGAVVRPDLGRTPAPTVGTPGAGTVSPAVGAARSPRPGIATRPAGVPPATLVAMPPGPGISLVPPLLAQTAAGLVADAGEAADAGVEPDASGASTRVHPPVPPPSPPSTVGAPSP
jgi:hypothetical protein